MLQPRLAILILPRLLQHRTCLCPVAATRFTPLLPRLHRSYLGPAVVTRFAPLVPPPPSSLPPPRAARTVSARTRRNVRRLVCASLALVTLYVGDRVLNYSTLSRNARTVLTCGLIAADYKLNFSPGKDGAQLARIHERNADRMLRLCNANGGLYQKIGQAIAMQSALLPPVVQQRFTSFFDETPQASWNEVKKVLVEDFGDRFPGLSGAEIADRLFVPDSFQKRAIGSASIAQVHKAQLPSGEWVAVKVQKPWIRRQVGMDLAVFRAVTYLFSTWMFGLPLSFLTPYICERLESETDFFSEASNAQRTAAFIATEPTIRDCVYVPKVYRELLTKRVMVAEWIDGIGVDQREIITGTWRDASSVGHPVNTPRSISAREGPIRRVGARNARVYGIGVREKDVMQTMVDIFCGQLFIFGWVHCDPHPGNILVRRRPNGKPQLVLLDHGLYITTTPEFRHKYALFWQALFTLDNATINDIASSWGIGNPDLFASATLLKPYQGGSKEVAAIVGGHERGGPRTAYEASQAAREKIAEFIINQDKMPRELVFIGRNLRIVQENNRSLGTPVNRLKIIANWASYALTRSVEQAGLKRSLADRVRAWYLHAVFKVVVLTLDAAFWYGRLRQLLFGGIGFEEEMDRRMRRVARDEFGLELQGDNLFMA